MRVTPVTRLLVTLVMAVGATGCGGAENNASPQVAVAAQSTVDAVRDAKSPEAGNTDAGERPSISEDGDGETGELLSRLTRMRPGSEMDDAIRELAGRGDSAVEEIGRRLNSSSLDYGGVHASVRVLKAVKSEASRTLLSRIALGEFELDSPNLKTWAARTLIEVEPKAARKLLAADSEDVRSAALNAVAQQSVDQETLELLMPSLEHEDPFVRWRAAEAMAAAPAGALADTALGGVIQGLKSVADIPDLDRMDENTRQMRGMTRGEAYYQRYLSTLIKSNADAKLLRIATDGLEGKARDTVLLALAHRDIAARDDVLRIARDPDAGLFRAWAVRALQEVGTPDDLPLLESIAADDPLVREGPLGPPNPVDSIGPTHPVRHAAKLTIRVIRKKSGMEPRQLREC